MSQFYTKLIFLKEEKEYSFDGDFLEFVGVNNPELKPQLKYLEGSKSLKERQVELVDFKELSKEKKQCYMYDTPGLYNSSQVHFVLFLLLLVIDAIESLRLVFYQETLF